MAESVDVINSIQFNSIHLYRHIARECILLSTLFVPGWIWAVPERTIRHLTLRQNSFTASRSGLVNMNSWSPASMETSNALRTCSFLSLRLSNLQGKGR